MENYVDCDQYYLKELLFGIAGVPHTIAQVAICNYPMDSGDCVVPLIAKLVKVGGV